MTSWFFVITAALVFFSITVRSQGDDISLTCPPDLTILGCYADDIMHNSNFVFSPGNNQINVDDFNSEGGEVSAPCGVAGLYYTDEVSGDCPTIVTRRFTLMDSCSNIVSCEQIIAVDDIDPPLITCPPSLNTDSCNEIFALTGLPLSAETNTIFTHEFDAIGGTVSDECEIMEIVYFDSYIGTCPSGIDRTFTATDFCGNTAACIQQITITNPGIIKFGCPADTTFDACEISSQTEIQAAFDNWIANAGKGYNGNCDAYVSMDNSVAPDICGGTATVTWTIPDTCENPQTCSATFTVVAPPALTFGSTSGYTVDACDFLINTDSASAQTALDAALTNWVEENSSELQGSITGGCNPVVVHDYSNQSVDICTGGSITITWTVEDICETTSFTATFSVDPPNPLSVNSPMDTTITSSSFINLTPGEAQDSLNQIFEQWIAWIDDNLVLDNRCGAATVSNDYTDQSINYMEGGNSVITWTVETGCETATTSAIFAVEPSNGCAADTIPPVISCPGKMEVESIYDIKTQTGLEFSTTSVDISLQKFEMLGGTTTDEKGVDSVSYVDFASGNCPAIVSRAFTLTDSCGNTSTCTQSIVIKKLETVTEATVCEDELPYNWNGIDYSTAGTYDFTTTNASGCDSVATLILNIEEHSSSLTEITICENLLPYNWNGVDHYEAGTYEYTAANSAGCDSMITLELNVLNVSRTATYVTVCGDNHSYLWNGTEYNAAGTYEYITTNAAGCDSIVTLTLSFGSYNLHQHFESACDSFTWIDGNTYTESGIYNYGTIGIVAGGGDCGDLHTLHLTINEIILDADITNADPRAGDNGAIDLNISGGTEPYTYVWSNDKYTSDIGALTAGAYTVTVTDAIGCTAAQTFEVKSLSDITSIDCPPDTSVNGNHEIPTRYTSLQEFENSGGQTSLGCFQGELKFDLLYEFLDTVLTPDVLKRTYVVGDECGNEEICIHHIAIENLIGALSRNQPSAFGCNIFPNPNNGHFNLMISGCSEGEILIRVYTAQGILVLSKNEFLYSETLTKQLDLSAMSKGVYQVAVLNGDKRINKAVLLK